MSRRREAAEEGEGKRVGPSLAPVRKELTHVLKASKDIAVLVSAAQRRVSSRASRVETLRDEETSERRATTEQRGDLSSIDSAQLAVSGSDRKLAASRSS